MSSACSPLTCSSPWPPETLNVRPVLFAVLSVFFVYRNDPYLDLRGEVARLVVRSR